ncbi:hypothetical protein AAFF_G00019220 [Aldrovandia affinis]|uniref:Ig-like domain-containing protein n=1 Tax=Aldrovandia affinis TaxID=143900 RepID=A0AAD7WH23_9TELE|nr:hypothetical protein AAFF_G00019220 [Aldrovandia affinis]
MGTMGIALCWTVVWISGYCHSLSAEVLFQNKYFIDGQKDKVTLEAPTVTNGTEFIWEWTLHDGRHKKAPIITIKSNGHQTRNSRIKYDILLEPEFKHAGVYSFVQTKPVNVNLAQVEVFGVKVLPFTWDPVREGSDVSRSCEVSRLPESATLEWERDGDPTTNTTLLCNSTAYIVIHSSDYTQGKYNCTLRWNGQRIFSIYNTLKVIQGTYETSHTLYRGSFNGSEVVLVSRSSFVFYSRATWDWEPVLETREVLVTSAEKDKPALVSMERDTERFSSNVFNGNYFLLRISPVQFGDSGRYACHFDRTLMALITLVTIQVSAEFPADRTRNQSAVLNCEISQVIDSVTLAWLRMEGDRGVLVKQEVLEPLDKRTLSLTLPSLHRDQLHWTCVVFTKSMLRAQAPLHLTLPPAPTQTGLLEISLACAVAVCVGLLLGVFLLYRRRAASAPSTAPMAENGEPSAPDAVYNNVTDLHNDQAPSTSPVAENGEPDTVYSNITDLQNDQGNADTPAQEDEGEGLQYLSFSLSTPSTDPNRQQRQFNPGSEQESDTVVYSSINTE